MGAHGIVVAIHAFAGATALVSMVFAMRSKKGGKVHRKSGKIYMVSMGLVCVLSWVASGLRIAEEGPSFSPLFLSLVGLLAGASAWAGWRALRGASSGRVPFSPVDAAVQVVLCLAGAAGVVWGLQGAGALPIAFGALSVSLGAGELYAMATPPPWRRRWLARHIGGVGAASISTVTAFLVVNLARLPTEWLNVVPEIGWWLAPTAIGVPVMYRATNKYAPKKSRAKAV